MRFRPGHWALRRRGLRIPSFALSGQSSLTPSLLLSNANPLRWALRWGRLWRLVFEENFRWCGSTPAPRSPNQRFGYVAVGGSGTLD